MEEDFFCNSLITAFERKLRSTKIKIRKCLNVNYVLYVYYGKIASILDCFFQKKGIF